MNMEFSEISTESLVKNPDKGCYLSRAKMCLLLLGAAAACTIVGVVVYFAHPDKKGSDEAAITTMMPTTTLAPATTSPRLPRTMTPNHYEIRLRPDIYRDDPQHFVFNGTVRIDIDVLEETDEITLHQRDLNIHDKTLAVTKGDTTLSVSYVKLNIENEFYTIVLSEPVSKGDEVQVYVEYDGPLRRDLRGMYWSSYQDNNVTKYLIASQLQSTDARKVFPCFDEPEYKATFKVSMEYRPPHTTIGNMDTVSTTELSDGWWVDEYDTTLTMSSYLLAFIVSDFQCKNSTSKSNKTVYVCARPNAIDQVDYALSVAADMQDFFEEYHNIPYPLPKTVHIAVPDFSAGAMENWGLIIYRETALLYEEGISSAAYRQRVAVVVSHELAHMWFGNLVTCKWWDDIWLNEGFASYGENLGVENQYTKESGDTYWEMEAQFVVDALQYVFRSDSLLSSHPVYQPVEHPDQIAQIFDGITYDKGSSVIRMMKYFLGEETFSEGLTSYLNENKYGVTNHTQLFSFLTQVAKEKGQDINVGEVMNTWILQMGYPVVTLTYDDGKIHMTQKRFLFEEPTNNEDILESPYNYKWQIPVTFMTSGNPDEDEDPEKITWLKDESGSVEASNDEPDWILGNVGQRFYYRVNYDDANWKALYDQLEDDHEVLNVINRAQIIDDSFSLGRAGEINQTKAFEAIAYLEKEEHYIPWRTLYYNIGFIRRMLQYTPNSIQPLQTFMQGLVSGTADSVGWSETGDIDFDHLNNRLRPLIHGMACSFQSPSCLSNASSLYQNWVADEETKKPSANLGSVVACYGVSQGDQVEWDFALTQYESSNVGSEKSDLLSALACASNETILQNYLEMLLIPESAGGKFRDQDAVSVMAAVSRNAKGKDLAWDFFDENYEEYIFPTFGTSTFRFASLITILTESFSTQGELDMLKTFIDEHPEQGTGEAAFKQALESTHSNLAWRKENEESIVAWLKIKNP